MLDQRKLMGMSVEITRAGVTIYKGNFGLRDYDRKLPVENSTLFRMASLSKSITAAGLMLLYEKGKFQFTDDISKHLGFKAVNPNFPDVPITIEMILSHQSSLLECSAYNSFLVDSYNAATGSQVPPLSSLFISGEKYFNACTFSRLHRPGSYFEYVNLNFVIAGTIIERLSGQRFDLYMRDNFFKEFSEAMNFNPAQLPVPNDLGVLYIGNAGSWQSDCDNYKGNIPQRNLTGYVIGSNAAVYGPQGSVRASVSDLTKYINIIRLKGLHEPTGKQLLQRSSVEQMTKWRYQFKGANYGAEDDFHAYGTGLFTTTYRTNDVQASTYSEHMASSDCSGPHRIGLRSNFSLLLPRSLCRRLCCQWSSEWL